MKAYLRDKAIALRINGLSYRQIQALVPVSRSTLSLWLRNIVLTKRQRFYLALKRLAGSKVGAVSRHQTQLTDTETIISQASKEIGTMSERDLWLIGIALYWAEGSKQKETNISQGVSFSNSDPNMLKLFLVWIEKTVKIPKTDLVFEIYLHASKSAYSDKVRNYWYNILSIPETIRLPVYFKNSPSVSRKFNTDYHGLVRIKVRKSSKLNRRISGWIKGLYWGIV